MIYERSARIAAICQLLRGANGTVAWDTIASAAGAPLGEIRSAITSARKALERDDGIVFETVWGTGLRRLSDTDIVRSSHRYVPVDQPQGRSRIAAPWRGAGLRPPVAGRPDHIRHQQRHLRRRARPDKASSPAGTEGGTPRRARHPGDQDMTSAPLRVAAQRGATPLVAPQLNATTHHPAIQRPR